MRQLLLFPHLPPADEGPPALDAGDRRLLIDLLRRGGSPQAACRKLGVDVAAFFRAAEEDDGFRRQLRHMREQLTENVASIVYQAAMKGTPAAQALWLRTFPPATYADPNTHTPSSPEPTDDFASLPAEALHLQLSAIRLAAADSPEPAA